MSYRLKLTITIALLIAISFSIGGTILISASFQKQLDTERQAALDNYESIQNTLYLLNAVGEQTGFSSLEEALAQMAAQNVGHWQGLILCSPDQAIYQSNPDVFSEYLLPTPAANQCSYTQVDDSYGHGLLVLSTIAAGEQRLTLQVRFDLSSVYNDRANQLQLFTVAYVIVVLFGIAASVTLSFALTGKLRRLAIAVRKISGGDLSTRSNLKSNDEFGQLSRDFDVMADKLQENISRMESEMQRQESFMGAFAHELKTPMTSIIGFADLLRQGNLDENTRMMAAEYIYTEGHRLEKLSFKLLDLLLLKKDSIQMRKVWLNTYLNEIERAMAPTLKKRGIRFVCRAEQARVALEPDLVKSLLYNLIDNAAKAMDSEGIIAVKATAIPGGCQFQVVDNGRGMEKAELTKITEAFYRVDKSRSRKQGGAGLGLALCKQIVELHNGSMQYASEPGKGTKVTVTLYGKEAKSDAE